MNEQTPVPPAPKPKKGWWGRNWMWFVPVGCLGSIAIVVGFIALIIGMVFGMMKSSEPYKYAVSQAEASAELQEAIGTPVEPGMFLSGNINVSGQSGQANISIPVSGPKGKATIHVNAAKSGGTWKYSTLVVDLHDSDTRIELRQ